MIYAEAAARAVELSDWLSEHSNDDPKDEEWYRTFMKLDTLFWFMGAIPWSDVPRTVDQARAKWERLVAEAEEEMDDEANESD